MLITHQKEKKILKYQPSQTSTKMTVMGFKCKSQTLNFVNKYNEVKPNLNRCFILGTCICSSIHRWGHIDSCFLENFSNNPMLTLAQRPRRIQFNLKKHILKYWKYYYDTQVQVLTLKQKKN